MLPTFAVPGKIHLTKCVSENLRIWDIQYLSISESQILRILISEYLRISESWNVSIWESQNLRYSVSQYLRISESENPNILISQNLRVLECQVSIWESQNLRDSVSQYLRILESWHLSIWESQNLGISVSQNFRVSESENFNILIFQNLRVLESCLEIPVWFSVWVFGWFFNAPCTCSKKLVSKPLFFTALTGQGQNRFQKTSWIDAGIFNVVWEGCPTGGAENGAGKQVTETCVKKEI